MKVDWSSPARPDGKAGLLFLALGVILAGCGGPLRQASMPGRITPRPPMTATTAVPTTVTAVTARKLPAAGEIVAIVPMGQERAAHSTTTLPDGRVLVVGGFLAEEGAAAGAEVYEPGTGRFAPIAAMGTPRHSHSATLLSDGRVLVAGGYGAGTTVLAEVEIFDPATNTFASAGSMVAARADHVAVLLGDGTVLLAGGVGPRWSFLSGAEVFDPTTGRSAPTGSMTVPRESHVAVRLADGRVLIAGGHHGRGQAMTVLASAEVYTPASGAFTPVGDMSIKRHKHDGALLGDGQVLITGGADERDDQGVYDSTEFFDPAGGRFLPGPSLNRPRYKHAGTSLLLPDGRLLIAGGAAQAEVYDPVGHPFSLVTGQARMAGQFSAAALLGDGTALITGGYGGGRGPRAEAWLVRP